MRIWNWLKHLFSTTPSVSVSSIFKALEDAHTKEDISKAVDHLLHLGEYDLSNTLVWMEKENLFPLDGRGYGNPSFLWVWNPQSQSPFRTPDKKNGWTQHSSLYNALACYPSGYPSVKGYRNLEDAVRDLSRALKKVKA